jgi:hypothetical protein
MTFKPGDDVIVTFDGQDVNGVVHSHLRGWVLAEIAIDPLWDYGSLAARLAPHSIVCVKEGDVRRVRLGESASRLSQAPES